MGFAEFMKRFVEGPPVEEEKPDSVPIRAKIPPTDLAAMSPEEKAMLGIKDGAKPGYFSQSPFAGMQQGLQDLKGDYFTQSPITGIKQGLGLEGGGFAAGRGDKVPLPAWRASRQDFAPAAPVAAPPYNPEKPPIAAMAGSSEAPLSSEAAFALGVLPRPKESASSFTINGLPPGPRPEQTYGLANKTLPQLRNDALADMYQNSSLESFANFLGPSQENRELAAKLYPGFQQAMRSGLQFDAQGMDNETKKMLGIGHLGNENVNALATKMNAESLAKEREFKMSPEGQKNEYLNFLMSKDAPTKELFQKIKDYDKLRKGVDPTAPDVGGPNMASLSAPLPPDIERLVLDAEAQARTATGDNAVSGKANSLQAMLDKAAAMNEGRFLSVAPEFLDRLKGGLGFNDSNYTGIGAPDESGLRMPGGEKFGTVWDELGITSPSQRNVRNTFVRKLMAERNKRKSK